MNGTRSNAALITGLVASLVAHLALLVPALVTVMTAPAPQRLRQARFDREDFRPKRPQQDDQEEPTERLGIDAPTPSSLTWVGYEQYQEHLARLAEVDQAAFTESPTLPQQPSEPAAPPTEPVEPQPRAEVERPVEQEPDRPPPAESTDAVERPEAPRGSARLLDPRHLLPVDPLDETNIVALDETDRPLDDEPATATPTEDDPIRAERPPVERSADEPEPTTPRDEPRPAETPAETAARPAEPVPTPAPTPPSPAATESPPDPGDPADKQSDPTSVIDAPPASWKAGRPLAAHGLELKPRRPAFTTLQSLTMAPGNPVVEIRFDRNGRPALARVLVSSGDRLADQSIVSSLYRWRASGARLKELQGEETVTIRLRIVLTGRR